MMEEQPGKKERKMKMTIGKIIRLTVVLIALSGQSYGQQDALYTQYNFNTQVFNPAYAGTWESMGFTVLGRYQWVGMPGSPRTATFSLQSPTRREKVSLGFDIVADKLGHENRLGVFGDYSYRLRVSEGSYLNLGLKGGFTNYSNDLGRYVQYPGDTPDPLSQGDVNVKFMPNFGVGAMLYSERYFVGFSVPRIIQNEFRGSSGNYSVESEIRHFYVHAGTILRLSESVKFRPTVLCKATAGAPLQADFTGSVVLRDRVWLGAMYRTGDSFGFLAQLVFDQKLRFGYSVDFSTTALRSYHNGSHELMVSYELGMKRRWSTPRMF